MEFKVVAPVTDNVLFNVVASVTDNVLFNVVASVTDNVSLISIVPGKEGAREKAREGVQKLALVVSRSER